MEDRELLEAAARAQGRRIVGWNDQHGGEPVAILDDGTFWQPLHKNYITDCDGDALRLAVKLEIRIDWGDFDVVAIEFENDIAAREAKAANPYAATRRAIVRAAAAMDGGKG